MTQRYGFGSSPLARGLRGSSARTASPPGIIPARAGFTGGPLGLSFSLPDHPRSRGVYPRIESSKRFSIGSSPLARGLHSPFLRGKANPWIIPARAGFTSPSPSPSRGADGSSPLARGLPAIWVETLPSIRIIPARAGFTQRIDAHHPRGEGSSPLARGLRSLRIRFGGRLRIIPARAGFTAFRSRTGDSGRDHPRSRGVYRVWSAQPTSPPGSSPLARGLRCLL